jgi:hypothetical protein
MPSIFQIVKQIPRVVVREASEWKQAIEQQQEKQAQAEQQSKRRIGFVIPNLQETSATAQK